MASLGICLAMRLYVPECHGPFCEQVEFTSAGAAEAYLEDLSSNGTYVNGACMVRGCRRRLEDCDKISLVLSVAPLVEQFFIFRKGMCCA
jgi:FHA domain